MCVGLIEAYEFSGKKRSQCISSDKKSGNCDVVMKCFLGGTGGQKEIMY